MLLCSTDPRWVAIALSDLDATLSDHAHCEKKAAATATKLVADHADRPELVRPLARLAQEEMQHFLAVLAELWKRGTALPPDRGDAYAQALMKQIRGRPTDRLLDRLLICALIEARSCERLGLLAEAVPEARLRTLYSRLHGAEAGHERLFADLAAGVCGPDAADARLDALARIESDLVRSLPLGPRIH